MEFNIIISIISDYNNEDIKILLGGLCLSKREAANGRGLTISCNSLGLIELVDNVLY